MLPVVHTPVDVNFVTQSYDLFESITLDRARTFDKVLAVTNEMHQATKKLSQAELATLESHVER